MSNQKPRLVVRRGPNPDHVYLLNNDTTIVGREPINDAMFPDPEVSRRHARIINQDGDYFIEDLNSTNGTFINGRRISEITRIAGGDIIDFGETVRVVFELQVPISSNGAEPLQHDPRLEALKDPRFQEAAGSKTVPPYASGRTNDDFYAQLEPDPSQATGPSGVAGTASSPDTRFNLQGNWRNWIIGAGCMTILIGMCSCGILLWFLDTYYSEFLYSFLP